MVRREVAKNPAFVLPHLPILRALVYFGRAQFGSFGPRPLCCAVSFGVSAPLLPTAQLCCEPWPHGTGKEMLKSSLFCVLWVINLYKLDLNTVA